MYHVYWLDVLVGVVVVAVQDESIPISLHIRSISQPTPHPRPGKGYLRTRHGCSFYQEEQQHITHYTGSLAPVNLSTTLSTVEESGIGRRRDGERERRQCQGPDESILHGTCAMTGRFRNVPMSGNLLKKEMTTGKKSL